LADAAEHLQLPECVDCAQARDEAAEIALDDGGAGVKQRLPAGGVSSSPE
jgi:hypothetical protein